MGHVKAQFALVGVLCGGCGATSSPYYHDIREPTTTIVQPPAAAPQCAPGGGDTVATNVYFEFQVEKSAIARDEATVKLMKGGNRVLLTFVVDTAGVPIATSVRPVYAADTVGARVARPVVAQLRFKPAELNGCRVRQLVQEPVHAPPVK